MAFAPKLSCGGVGLGCFFINRAPGLGLETPCTRTLLKDHPTARSGTQAPLGIFKLRASLTAPCHIIDMRLSLDQTGVLVLLALGRYRLLAGRARAE